MPSLSVAVLGAGTAGLAASLAFARAGHRVTLIERDVVTVDAPIDAMSWQRRGIPHFQQPHAFIPRGRLEMRAHFPDVFAALIEAGAQDLDMRPKIPGALRPDDKEIAFLAARRPIIEWALRRAVLAEPGIEVLSDVRAIGYAGESGDLPRVTGVLTTTGPISADLIVDAMGRRSPSSDWVVSLGGHAIPERSTDCGIIYYSRYYRVRDGLDLPDGPWLLGPRGDLGYGNFTTFPGDNRTFAAVIAIPPGDQGLKVLRHAPAFEAATATMPALHAWTDADMAEPITDVLPMGSLQNTLRGSADGARHALGVISVADAACHTDPAMALGLSFSFIHAAALAAAVGEHPSDVGDIALAFDAATRPEMAERFAFASEIDAARSRLWAGESVDVAHRDGGAFALFSLVAGTAAAFVDAEIFRTVVRRTMLLDPLAVLDEDVPMQERIEGIFGELVARPRPRPGPPRAELVAVVTQALA